MPTGEIQVLERDHPSFPKSVLLVESPPERLYAIGDLSMLEGRRVGIVGSRQPSAYGIRVTYDAAKAAARAGLVVVSGLARGLDARAHRGALDAGGKTIAVLGCGVDVCYPLSNRDLYDEVRAKGLLLSEMEPGTRPRPEHFPRRNRIIAGLVEYLLVVEGKVAGGTSNTAQWMLGLGKHILAVPGRIDEATAESPNKLISDGATLYRGPEDLFDAYGIALDAVEARERRELASQIDLAFAAEPDLLDAEAKVFDLLAAEPVHVDEIAERTALDAGTLLAALSSLELKGLAVQLPGKQFALTK
ncbi:MAG TPA: DNA-processing protein DprA [Gemmatimonadales bacterium]|nr:DNA-processing protein DprA [Gemmatimonadales bacterium]